MTAAVQHKDVGNAVAGNGELEFIRLDGACGSGTESALNEFAFIGFKHIALPDEIIQLARFDALAENIIMFPPEPGASAHKQN